MNAPRLGVVIFARSSSARLPGKMLMPLGEFSLLERMIRRAALLGKPIVVATSTDPADDEIASLAVSTNAQVYRGDLEDVLARALGAARFGRFDAFARLCGDRPFFPVEEIEQAFKLFAQAHAAGRQVDLITNQLHGPTAAGTTTEVIRTDALEQAMVLAGDAEDREHMTRVFYRRASSFRIQALPKRRNLPEDASLAIDTENDWIRLGEVVHRLPHIDASPDDAWRILSTL